MPHSSRLHTVAANRKIITHRVRKAYSCLLIEDHIKNAWLKCSFWSGHFSAGPANENNPENLHGININFAQLKTKFSLKMRKTLFVWDYPCSLHTNVK